MDVSHSVSYHINVEQGSGFLYKQKFVDLRQALPSLQHGLLRSQENVVPINIVLGMSPTIPIVDNLHMEDFDIKTIHTAEHPPGIWKGYVGNMFVVIETSKKEKFLEHINSLDLHIQFTTEETRADRSIPFLDTLVGQQSGNSLMTTVYRKSTQRLICTYSGTIITTWLPG